MSRYKVMMDDNFHYMEEDERYELGTFSTIEEAIAACKRILDDDLSALAKGKNYTPEELYEHYVSFGSDPFIVALDPKEDRPSFSAWDAGIPAVSPFVAVIVRWPSANNLIV